MTVSDSPGPAASRETKRTILLGWALAAALSVLMLDAAVETFSSGSPLRWWVLGVPGGYGAALVAAWRLGKRGVRLPAPGTVALAAAVILLGLIAATAWGPDGLTQGIRLLGRPTPWVLSVLGALGVVLAGVGFVRAGRLPLAARVGLGAIAAYAAAAFIAAAVSGTPFDRLFTGESLWRPLPALLQGAFLGGAIVLPLGLAWTAVRLGLRRPPEVSIHAELWKLTAIVASMAIVLAGMPLRSGSRERVPEPETLASLLGIDPGAPRLTPAELDAALANSFRALEDGERESARDRWDPAYVAAGLGRDPARIFAWVQHETNWIPYKGFLRGPVGVLMDRLGNSLDRAVLLATLMRESKRHVRLARATLAPDDAVVLLPRLLAGRHMARAPSDADDTDLALIAAQYQLDAEHVQRTLTAQADSWTRKESAVLDRLPDQTTRLAAAVAPHARAVDTAFDTALETLRDHWWVQTLEGGTWRDLDLAAPSPGEAMATPEQTFALGSIPAQQRHQITLRVIAEQWSNGSLREQAALQHALAPADLIGTPVVLRFVPERPPKGLPPANSRPEQALRTLALEQREWTPVLLIGRKPFSQSTIRENGELTRTRPPQPAQGRALTGMTRALEDALGPSREPADSKSAPHPARDTTSVLTAAWLEYEIHAPGDRPQKIRRAVFDLIGPAARAAGQPAAPQIDDAAAVERSFALMMETDILPVVCRFAPEYLTHLAAQRVLANRDLLAAVMRNELADDFAHAQKVAERFEPLPTPLYNLALARFEWSRFADWTHIDRPNILTRHVFVAPAGNGFNLVVATDIVANGIGVDLAAGDPFAIRLEQGVLDTNAEALLTSGREGNANAGSAYTRPGAWTTLASRDDPRLASLQLSEDVRQRIADDLAAGFVVVAPTAPVALDADHFTGWWRIDPATGQTLGMGSTGWGQQYVEFLIVVAYAASLGFLFAYLWCRTFTGEGPIANNCVPGGRLLEYFVAPVHAIGSDCLRDALLAALLAGLLGALAGRGLLRRPGGGGGGGRGGPGGSRGEPVDPNAPTPGPGAGPGGPGGRPPGGGGSGPGGGRGPGQRGDFFKPDDSWPPEVKSAFENWVRAHRRSIELMKANRGRRSPEVARAGDESGRALSEWFKAKEMFGPSGTGPGGTQIRPPAGSPGSPTGPTGSPTPTQPDLGPTLPQSPFAPTQPGTTGPTGTQIMPPTGPTGTQIMQPQPGATTPTQPDLGATLPQSPFAPTQPGTGKTLTGLGGVLNTMGKKGGS